MKKKVILLFVSIVMLASAGFTQDFRSSIHFGPKVGLNLSNVYDSEGDDFYADTKMGLAAGVFFSIPVGTFLGIQPELLFSQKGFKSSGSILGDDYTFTRTLNFIDVPLLLAVKPSEWLTIVAGVYSRTTGTDLPQIRATRMPGYRPHLGFDYKITTGTETI